MAGYPAGDLGLARFGGGHQVHSLSRRDRLHERHRGHHLLVARSRICSACGWETLPAHFLEKWAAFAEHFGTASLPALGVAVGSLRRSWSCWPKLSRTRSRARSWRSSGPRRGGARRFDVPVETIGSRFGEHPRCDPDAPNAGSLARAHPRALLAGRHGSAPGGDRVAAVGRGGGRHDRQPPQVQRRARGAGHREHRVGALRRHAGDGGDRPDGHERQERAAARRWPA